MNDPDISDSDAPPVNGGKSLPQDPRRFRWFVLAMAAWALVIVARMSQIMIFDREHYLADMNRESWHRGMIPAPRGRILDSSGIPLAWSVRRLRLHWRIPADPSTAWEQWEQVFALPDADLNISPPDIPARYGQDVLLLDDVPAHLAVRLQSLIRDCSAFSLDPWFVRYQAGPPELRRDLGYTIQRNGMEIGLNGYEKLYDSILRGRPGIFRVMVDARGEWIMSTWEIVQQMQPGYDVFLPRRKE